MEKWTVLTQCQDSLAFHHFLVSAGSSGCPCVCDAVCAVLLLRVGGCAALVAPALMCVMMSRKGRVLGGRLQPVRAGLQGFPDGWSLFWEAAYSFMCTAFLNK